MRILVDCRHLNSNEQSGVGEYTIQILHALFELQLHAGSGDHAHNRKHEFILLTTGKQKPDLLSIFQSRSLHPLTPPSGRGEDTHQTFPPFVKHVHVPIANKFLHLKILFTKNPSIDQLVDSPIDLIFLPNLNVTILPKNIPTVLTIHDLSWKFFPEFFSRKMRVWHRLLNPRELIKCAHTIITPSNITRADVHRVFQKPLEAIGIIPHGITPNFHPKMEARDHGIRSKFKLPKRFAFFVGTIEPRKNILSIIEGVKRHRETTHDNLHLVLVGKWGWKSHSIRRRLWKRDTHGWVHNLEYIDPHDLPAIYRSAAIFLWPSFYEGFGLPLLEAMASGVPIITSNISSMPEVTGTTAIHVDPFNIQDIADALKGVVQSKPLQEQLKKGGVERAAEFSWKKAAEQTLGQFQKATK
jgi:glycosyltransferase involved in cell wall biosynthesis